MRVSCAVCRGVFSMDREDYMAVRGDLVCSPECADDLTACEACGREVARVLVASIAGYSVVDGRFVDADDLPLDGRGEPMGVSVACSLACRSILHARRAASVSVRPVYSGGGHHGEA